MRPICCHHRKIPEQCTEAFTLTHCDYIPNSLCWLDCQQLISLGEIPKSSGLPSRVLEQQFMWPMRSVSRPQIVLAQLLLVASDVQKDTSDSEWGQACCSVAKLCWGQASQHLNVIWLKQKEMLFFLFYNLGLQRFFKVQSLSRGTMKLFCAKSWTPLCL